MAYEPTFSVNAIGRDEPKALAVGIESMGFLLGALTSIDEAHLRRFANVTPRLYKSGARYDPLDPPPGSMCGDDKWADIPTILNTQDSEGHPLLDCEDAACWRASEANVVMEVGRRLAPPVRCKCCNGTGQVFRRVEPYVLLRRDYITDENGDQRRRHLYHIVDLWPEGLSSYPNTVQRVNGLLIEDPSKVLGM